jgi:hypothetical protein
MYTNIIELIDVIISSSLFHMLIVVAIIYYIYETVIFKENENVIANEAANAIDVFFNTLNQNISAKVPMLGQFLTKAELKQLFASSFPSTSTATINQINQINQDNNDYNKPILNRLNNYFIIFGSITLGFVIIYNTVLYKKISYRHVLTEIFLSTFISFGLIALYEYLFVYKFIFNYIDYHLYDFFKNKLFYLDEYTNISTYESVFGYNNPIP